MNKLKILRLEKQLTLRELARQTNISHPTLSRLETHQTTFNEENLIILSNFFGVTTDLLLGISNDNEEKTNEIISNNIRKLRQLKGLTQQELANKLFLSKHNISDYEIGRTEPDIKTLIKIAGFFEVSIDYLLGVEQEHPTQAYFNDLELELFKNIKEFTEEQKKYVLEIIKLTIKVIK